MASIDVRLHADAQANLDTYDEHDEPLSSVMHHHLERIRSGAGRDAAVRRAGGGTVWSIAVTVYGRDDEYQVLWVEVAEGLAVVVHLGRALTP